MKTQSQKGIRSKTPNFEVKSHPELECKINKLIKNFQMKKLEKRKVGRPMITSKLLVRERIRANILKFVNSHNLTY